MCTATGATDPLDAVRNQAPHKGIARILTAVAAACIPRLTTERGCPLRKARLLSSGQWIKFVAKLEIAGARSAHICDDICDDLNTKPHCWDLEPRLRVQVACSGRVPWADNCRQVKQLRSVLRHRYRCSLATWQRLVFLCLPREAR